MNTPNHPVPSEQEGATKHTPTPWHFVGQDGTIRSAFGPHHRPEDSTQMADHRGAIVCSLMDGLGTWNALGGGREHALAEFRANAALIVKAVNSHAAQQSRIAALEGAVREYLKFGSIDGKPERKAARERLAALLPKEAS